MSEFLLEKEENHSGGVERETVAAEGGGVTHKAAAGSRRFEAEGDLL